MERDPNLRLFREGYSGQGYLPPAVVVEEALKHIQADGTVRMYDEAENEWYLVQPYEPVQIETLTPDNFAATLSDVAHAIEAAVSHIGLGRSADPDRITRNAKHLAITLTAYRHNPAFIDYATSLVGYEADVGALTGIDLPEGSPWDWSPPLQAELATPKKA